MPADTRTKLPLDHFASRADDADDARQQEQDAHEDRMIEEHFCRVPARALVEMWATARHHETAKVLSDFEWQALAAQFWIRWQAWPAEEFGCKAPNDGQKPPEPDAPPVQVPERVMSRKEVAGLLGISTATLDRMQYDGRMPKRLRLSPGRVGYAPAEVRALLDTMGGRRRNVARRAH